MRIFKNEPRPNDVVGDDDLEGLNDSTIRGDIIVTEEDVRVFNDSTLSLYMVERKPQRDMIVLSKPVGPGNITGSPGQPIEITFGGTRSKVPHADTFTYRTTDENGDETVGNFFSAFKSTIGDSRVFTTKAVSSNGHTSNETITVLTTISVEDVGFTSLASNLPNEVISGSTGTMTLDFVSNISNVKARIVNNRNIIVDPGPYNNGEQITYEIQPVIGTGHEVSFDVILETANRGNISIAKDVTRTVRSNNRPELVNVIHNFPLDIEEGEIIPFAWTGGFDADGDTIFLNIVSAENVQFSKTSGIAANEVVTATVTGNNNDLVQVRYVLRDTSLASAEVGFVSRIRTPPPNIENLDILSDGLDINDQVFQPCDVVSIIYQGAVDLNNLPITVSLQSGAGITFDTILAPQGTVIRATIPCDFNADLPADITATISNGISSVNRVILLNVDPVQGAKVLTSSGIFTKPAGVTTLGITSRGGILQNTIITGLVSHVFAGSVIGNDTIPEAETIYVHNLPGEEGTITVNLADDVDIKFIW